MNILHMKYAVEIAETNSINKAAERLFVGQPNLSRAIKELEAGLGITIFERSSKGMTLTPDGETFIRYAKSVLKQIDNIKTMFSNNRQQKKRFSISVPRASYIADAFVEFSKALPKDEEIEVFYKETNSMRTIKNIVDEDYKLGVVRYAENFDKYYNAMIEEKKLTCETICEFKYVLLMSRDCALASKENISYEDLKDYIEVAHADPYVPSLSFAEVKKEELPDNSSRRIFLFERASQFELLARNPECFMWVSPTPEGLKARHNLVERPCSENERVYRDVLIHRKDYTLSPLDDLFIEYVTDAKRKIVDKL